ncbi:ribosome small subunit-dependent GTPase A [Porphyromonas sp.]|uniref:ribosome small subunit-dependent GTPase A n=1 Tax=Porphyromonas sp. TaxID=1924944 RepID=UPI0026DAD280|nr:ribosome small subunit-dependent GTPase A [Porphyromonas sp.]MDO4695421.1 ribosome small subunit-dependent GTPase A [Porphyromonas sp.]MDO4770531.1 ribosome small subunit-dependent GTPase A [Porphyromonas sp.]
MVTYSEGVVITNTGSFYTVKVQNETFICKVKGSFKLKGIRTTNPVAVGDHVSIEVSEDNNLQNAGWITKIHPRSNYIIRRSSNLSKQAHILAANIDRALLLVTVNYPVTTTTFIDRFLSTAEAYNIETTIVFNKIDRYNHKDLEDMETLKKIYEEVGYKCFGVSAITGEGVDALLQHIRYGVTLVSGHSGVGKSTFINKIIPNADLKTADISEAHNTGMHTTTYSTMIPLEGSENGYVIDTPGIKGFGTLEFEKEQVGHFFPEIFRISEECKFNNCTHTHEPNCAVLQALADGKIAPSRYKSYLSIINDEEEDKYRSAY